MFHSSKPYSAVTVQIEVLTSEQYEVDDSSGIVDLIEAVTIQSSGPTEASRALRKKLKYGNLHRQLRALTILDFLIQNAGDRFLREFADEPLLERLRIAATDSVSDPMVKQKCKQLFGQWAVTYKDTPGMGGITGLYRQLPKRKQPANQAKAKVLRETGTSEEPPMGHTVSISAGNGPSTILSGPKHKHSSSKSLKKDKKDKKEKRFRAPFILEKEKPEILQTLASSSVASTNLLNALKLVNRETHRVSEDVEVLNRFETCKQLRRQILRYIQNVESEEFLGSLIHANEELVTALMAFEVLDKSVDYDSDSDQDVLETGWTPDRDDVNESFAGLVINPPKPPRPRRPTSISVPSSSSQPQRRVYSSESESETDEDDDDENNPFGDRNAIRTPGIDKFQPTWREI
ncbi:LSB5 family protein [Aspergillus tanneri]|uniref:Putative actin patch assembly and actin polymerization protein n=1 Tax=Aspergillus tanneri TaxID=1220188 RepID=A0A5M9MPE5_9EURO|nr:putative actin patch assembly and actin polymerization protein [Aspergillus tanneri]KAA8644517.1 putative actin patch assembly and actin polymerization protein [Aspergillus tanneri]